MSWVSTAAKRIYLIIIIVVVGLAPLVGAQLINAQESASNAQFLHHTTAAGSDRVVFQTIAHAAAGIDEDQVSVTLDGQPISLSQQSLQQLNQAPFHLVILFDTSGSMWPVAAEMRAQLDTLLNTLPENAQVSIYRFNETVELTHPFSAKGVARAELMAAVDSLEPEIRGTCLYDALTHVITSVGNVVPNSPRRAVLVLSDGRDELSHDSNAPCSAKSEADAVNQAISLDPPLPIYALGFEGGEPLREEVLASLTGKTNGRYLISEGQPLFSELVDYFRNQWLLTVEMFPPEGNHDGVASLVTNDGQTISRPFAFTAVRDYSIAEAPPEELVINLANFAYKPDKGRYEVDVSFSDPLIAERQEWWLIRIDALPNQETRATTANPLFAQETISQTFTPTATFPITKRIFVDLNQPQSASIFNTVDTRPLPNQLYLIQILPAGTNKLQDVVIAGTQQTIWKAPPMPELVIDHEITSLRTPQLHLTYTVDNPQFLQSIEGYIVDANDLTRPYFITIPIDSSTSQLEITQVITPLRINRFFGTYTIMTYLKGHDGEYLNARPRDIVIDNTIGTLFTGWVYSGWTLLLMIPSLWYLLILLICVFIYLLTLYIRARPLPPPVLPINTAEVSQQFAFRVLDSPDDTHAGQAIMLDDEVFVIGREGCNFNLPGDRQISRRHVTIEKEENDLYITDLNSRNGTFVQGERLSPHQRRRLQKNAEVQLGSQTFLRFI